MADLKAASADIEDVLKLSEIETVGYDNRIGEQAMSTIRISKQIESDTVTLPVTARSPMTKSSR